MLLNFLFSKLYSNIKFALKIMEILSLLVTLINTKLQAALAGQYEMHFKLLKK